MNSKDELRILGVDPGLHVTGYGILVVRQRGCQLAEAGVVRGPARGEFAQRVRVIHDGICEVIESCRPAVLALEELYSHYQRPQTAILMGHARGVICLAAAMRSIPVVGYSATQVKKILTGSGRAPKAQIQSAIQRELNLAEVPQPADVADALAIALCHYYLADRPAVGNGVASSEAQGSKKAFGLKGRDDRSDGVLPNGFVPAPHAHRKVNP